MVSEAEAGVDAPQLVLPRRLLQGEDPESFELYRPAGAAPMLFLCDHASARIPEGLDQLGLAPERLAEHIAYDIGAGALARRLADRFDAPGVLGAYSRLVIDLNRYPGAEGSIPRESDRVPIPGNEALSAADRAAREREIFVPYHQVVTEQVAWLRSRAPDPLVVSVHSFTPRMDGREREWEIGILSNEDRRVADPLLERLRAIPGLTVGDNKPYSAVEPLGYTTVRHCDETGLRYALIEVRQDEITDEAGIARWTEILAEGLEGLVPGAHRTAARA